MIRRRLIIFLIISISIFCLSMLREGNREVSAASPTKTPAVVATPVPGEEGMREFIEQLQKDKKLDADANKGKYSKLEDFDKSEAKMDYYFWYPTGHAPHDFVFRANVAWESASDTANWDRSGSGFVFRQSDDKYYIVMIKLDGNIYIGRVDQSKDPKQQWTYLAYKYYGKPDLPKGQAYVSLVVNKGRINVYVNNKLAASAFDQALEGSEVYRQGKLNYMVFSGTNVGFGLRVQMTDADLWEIEEVEPTPLAGKTPTKVADNTVLWEQDFENGKADGWYVGHGTWKVIKTEDGKKAYEGTGTSNYPQIWLKKQGQEWRDYAFESKIKLLKGAVQICFRTKGSGDSDFYNVFMPAGGDTISINKFINGDYKGVKNISFDVKEDTWYDVRIEVIGPEFHLFIDDRLIGEYTFGDADYLKKGTIGYYIGGADDLQIDSVKVWTISKFTE